MHAVDFLKSPADHEIGPIVVVYGADLYFRTESTRAACSQIFPSEEVEDGPTRVAGKKDADLRLIFDTLRTVSMWSERQVVIVEEADEFVTENRAALEKYADHPSRKGVLLLDLKTFPATTKLAKKVSSVGLVVDCKPLDGAPLLAWIGDHVKRNLGKKLLRPAAQQLVELVGNESGRLVQELGKLAAYVGSEAEISAEAVQAVVGGWRLRTTWEMLDAVLDGQTGTALKLLDQLLENGDAPQQLMGGINWMFRPLAQATELAQQGMPLRAAMTQAGVRSNSAQRVEAFLRRIGSGRASRISRLLLQADWGLKGRSGLKERTILEDLLVRLSGR